MRAYERLLKYVSVYTTSDPDSATVPSSMRQYDLAHQLVDELKALGLENVHVDENCVVYGWLSATAGCEKQPALGFIAHMDTAPDCAGENVKPQIIENYDGGDVLLAGSGETLSPAAFPTLKNLAGMTLITTDGTTLLGADDKAGIAEIMTALESIISERSRTESSASPSRRMRKSARASITSTSRNSARCMPIPWMAARRAKSPMKPLTPVPRRLPSRA